jgi:peptidoglycan hydrolase-like protein with peptidoglycan-binding domain
MSSLNFEPESFSAFTPSDSFDAHEGPTTLSMRPIQARILWPALGFPAVINPRPTGSPKPLDSDTSRSICALILSDSPKLTSHDAAQYLRIVPWSDRNRRQIPAGQPGSFDANDIEVRGDVHGTGLSIPVSDDQCDAIAFGGVGDQKKDPIVVGLARRVRDFYRQKLPFLYEIRVSESASARLAEGQYQLFWNGSAAQGQPSDEMSFLIEAFAKPQRRKLGASWSKFFDFLVNEYKYEYGALHPPYQHGNPQNPPLTEVLHPVFVSKQLSPLRIGHLTDTHVDVRWDVYEANLRKEGLLAAANFDNCNRNFIKIYDEARQQSDLILLTGDLIDYGRGHIGPGFDGRFLKTLGQDDHYHEDRNWFLFYYFLASGDHYSKPAYTILGNHDWRLNPYPPFAPGAPKVWELFSAGDDPAKNPQLAEFLKRAHSDGWQRKYSYSVAAESALGLLFTHPVKALTAALGDLTQDGSPLQTRIESIAWYLLLINPFLDYSVRLPGGQQLLMLDWGKDEELLYRDDPRDWTSVGPRAEKVPTKLQKWLTGEFLSTPGQAKVIGVHAPPIGPYPEWTDADLMQGVKTFRSGEDSRVRTPDGRTLKMTSHTLFAIRPQDQPYRIAADYGSFGQDQDRNWFITSVSNATHGVRLVLSGHIHRRGLFTVPRVRQQGKDVWKLQDVSSFNTQGVRSPLAATSAGQNYLGPLYVNTTSAGPLGHQYGVQYKSMEPGWSWMSLANDGTIVNLTHVPPRFVQARSPTAAARSQEFESPLPGSSPSPWSGEYQSPDQGQLMNSNLNFEAEAFSAYQPQSENYEQLEQEHHSVHGGHSGGHMFHGLRRGGRGSWWRRHRSGSGDSMQDPQSIGFAQNCLAQITGSQVSQSGRMGHSTRRAIRKFQMQNQLQPTGRLDQNTMSALQQACGDQDGGGDQGDGDNETGYSGYEFDQPPVHNAPPPVYTPRNCDNDKMPSPSGVNRALTSARVQCPTRADAQRILAPVIKKAVEMLNHTIAELTHARDAACRGEPLGWPNLREVTACWLKYKLGVCIDDPATWIAGTFSSGSVAEVIRRLVRPRDLLASNEIVYICDQTCKKPSTIAWTHVANRDKDGQLRCIPGAPDRKIHLCPPFWTDAQAPFREQTLIHEAVHLTHCAAAEDTGTRVSIGSPECLAQFVAATNLQALDPDFAERCGFTKRCGAVPRQQFGRNCGAKTAAAPPPLPDWRP